MTIHPGLAAVPLFAGLDEEDLARIDAEVDELTLEPGEELFREGTPGAEAYLIVSGDLEIAKSSAGREVLLAVRSGGDVIGEMALIDGAPRIATARARTTVRLLRIPKAVFDSVLATSAPAVRSVFGVLLQRWRSTEVQLRQSEKMAQIGTLSAGLAHEINNPAAAVQRAAGQLSKAVSAYAEARASAPHLGPPFPGLLERASSPTLPPALDSLERSDREQEVEETLERLGVKDGWRLAPSLVDSQIGTGDLADLASVAGSDLTPAVRLLCTARQSATLIAELETGAARLSEIVAAFKSYSHLDRAPVDEVDVPAGIESTLVILRSKTRGIDVDRSYVPDLPRITAYPAQLNQVWTNLIDNAVDAIRETGRSEGRIAIRVFAEEGWVVVEIEDDGAGIPEAVRQRIFDPFYTTKPPGKGTGLGLNLVYTIVVFDHGGNITFESAPGRTVFRVELPVRAVR